MLIFSTPDPSLFASCDDKLKIYFDGDLQYEESASDPWDKEIELKIPRGTKVLGLECKDTGGGKGILASTSDGMVTDGNWLCSSNQNLDGWAEPGFEDTNGDFSVPTLLEPNGFVNYMERYIKQSYLIIILVQ